MNAEDRKSIRDRISRLVEKTEKKIRSMESMAQPISPENAIGRVSRMDAINNKSVVEAALRTAKKELEDLQWAKKYIDHPDFGCCKRCKRPINIKRLLLMPGSKNCVKCA